MALDFDKPIRRRGTDSRNWAEPGEGVIPLTGAELEFPPAMEIAGALRERLEHPMLGYNREPHEPREVVVERLIRRGSTF